MPQEAESDDGPAPRHMPAMTRPVGRPPPFYYKMPLKTTPLLAATPVPSICGTSDSAVAGVGPPGRGTAGRAHSTRWSPWARS
jgi:hypothetical protein